jgi:hypothetical protein
MNGSAVETMVEKINKELLDESGYYSPDDEEQGEVVDGSFEYVQSPTPTQNDAILQKLLLMEQAAKSGMFMLAGSVVVSLSKFQDDHFKATGRIISIKDCWKLLVNTVNLAMPDE